MRSDSTSPERALAGPTSLLLLSPSGFCQGPLCGSFLEVMSMKVYEAIARTVSDTVKGPVFGLMGDGNLDLLAEFADKCGRTVIHTRHEQNAVAMADGYSRFSVEVVLCSVTQRPGLTNNATSLAVARHHNS